jgi:hypothetical protein
VTVSWKNPDLRGAKEVDSVDRVDRGTYQAHKSEHGETYLCELVSIPKPMDRPPIVMLSISTCPKRHEL